jgi:hypothetical protein
MAKRFIFSIEQAIPAAWDFLWAHNLKARAKCEAENPNGVFGKYARRWYTRTFYICAADMVAQVRSFAYETAKGLQWGTNGVRGPDYGIRMSGDLDGRVRTWLLRTKDGHNFGRGHISGMRFRPKGAPLGPSEQDTIKEQAKPPKPRTIHFGKTSAYSGGSPLCIAVQRFNKNEERKANGLPTYYQHHGRSNAVCRDNWEGVVKWGEPKPVNCPRCLKLKDHPLAKKAA